VKLQGKTVIDKLDIFEKPGRNRALDYTFKEVKVADQLFEYRIRQAGRISQHRGDCRRRDDGRLEPIRGPAFHSQNQLRRAGITRITRRTFFRKKRRMRAVMRQWTISIWIGPTLVSVHPGRSNRKIFTRLDGHLPRPAEWSPARQHPARHAALDEP